MRIIKSGEDEKCLKRIILILLALSILLISCSQAVSFEGSIVEILPDSKQILIENSQGEQILLRIKGSTKIKSDEGSLSFKSLQVGQQVKGWYDGSIKESLPPQAAAEKIEIIP